MKQKVSDRMTVHIQAWSSLALAIVLIWAGYRFNIWPEFDGLLVVVEWAIAGFGSSFIALNVVGIVMWVANLFFYYIQLARHGPPSAQFDE